MDDGFSQDKVFGFLRLISVRGSIALGGGVRGSKWDSPRLIIALHYTFSYFPPILIFKLSRPTGKERERTVVLRCPKYGEGILLFTGYVSVIPWCHLIHRCFKCNRLIHSFKNALRVHGTNLKCCGGG